MAFEPEFVIKQIKKFKHSVIGWGMPGRQNKFDSQRGSVSFNKICLDGSQ